MSESKQQSSVGDPPEPPKPCEELIKWEEWALATEEHFDAQQRWRADPSGVPMGHRKKKKRNTRR